MIELGKNHRLEYMAVHVCPPPIAMAYFIVRARVLDGQHPQRL